MNDVAPGWAETTFGEVSQVVGGSTPKTAVPEYWNGDIAWLTPDDLSGYSAKHISRGRRSISQAGYDSTSVQMMPPGAVLFTSRAPIGYVAIADGPVCTNQGFKSFVPYRGVSSDYLYWYLRHATPDIRQSGSGTTFREISKNKAASIPLLLAPEREQRRIVDAIETQLSRIDAGVKSLVRAQRNIARMRAAVLKAAIEGKLVSDPAPEKWPIVALSDVCEVVSGQTPKGVVSVPGGTIPFFKVGDMNLAKGRRMATSRFYLDDETIQSLKIRIRPPGTVVFPKRGGAIQTNKKRILVEPSAFDLNTMGVVPGPLVDSLYLWLWFSNIDLATLADGSNVPQINHGDIKPLKLRLPPLDEQRVLAQEADRHLSVLDAMEAEVQTALNRASDLQRTVLATAFSGSLVPQDPADEPACVLLDRIRAEREGTPV